MMRKLAKVSYRVAPLYNDEPNGTIVEVLDDLHVMVQWDAADHDRFAVANSAESAEVNRTRKEQIKYLRKGLPVPSHSAAGRTR